MNVFFRLIIFLAIIFFISCKGKQEKNNPVADVIIKDSIAPTVSEINKDYLLSATGKQILLLLKNKQYDSLTVYFSDSVHFSPYGFIGSGEQTLTAAQFSSLLSSNKKIKWGDYDGSGEPIDLTAKEYLQKFVYNADFLNAEKVSVDKFIGSGNSLNNLKSIYPNARFIEYHFSGFDKKYAGMDWASLRLVFTEKDNKYLLVAFVNDRWTI